MILSFANGGTEDVFSGANTRAARQTCPQTLHAVARRKLDQLNAASRLLDMRAPPGNRLEKLSGDREGQYSVRINDQYRICFRWLDDGPGQVKITDYH